VVLLEVGCRARLARRKFSGVRMGHMTRAPILAVAALLLAGCVPASPDPGIPLPPVGAGLDYQLGGAYDPPPGVSVVVRDSTAEPAPGAYSVCYVNGFQTQPGEGEHWLSEHPDLVLHADGEPVADPDWPDEYLLDTSTEEKRMAIAALLGTVVASCAISGFDAVELDNLDSYTRSGGALTFDDNLDLAARYARVAHDLGMAVAQKNAAADSARLRAGAGFDLAIAEDCARYAECDAYTAVYGELVFDVEYSREHLAAACAAVGSAVLRDRDLVPAGSPGYVFEGC
jgi:Uncharacterized conserved protein